MAHEDLDALLSKMEGIAKAVNAFNSETVQREAFSVLISAFDGRRHSAKQSDTSHAHMESAPQAASAEKKGGPEVVREPKQRKNAKVKRSDWTLSKDLDLHPAGKQSFSEFVSEKTPSSNEDKYAVVVYYLSEILPLPAVSMDHVGSTFRLTKAWKEPIDVAAGLLVKSSRKGTVDTSRYRSH